MSEDTRKPNTPEGSPWARRDDDGLVIAIHTMLDGMPGYAEFIEFCFSVQLDQQLVGSNILNLITVLDDPVELADWRSRFFHPRDAQNHEDQVWGYQYLKELEVVVGALRHWIRSRTLPPLAHDDLANLIYKVGNGLSIWSSLRPDQRRTPQGVYSALLAVVS